MGDIALVNGVVDQLMTGLSHLVHIRLEDVFHKDVTVHISTSTMVIISTYH